MAESLVLFDPRLLEVPISYHNECSASPLWNNWYPRLRVAIFAILLFYYIVCIPALVVITWRRTLSAKHSISWKALFSAVFFMIVALLLGMIGDSFLNCRRMQPLTYLKIFDAFYFFHGLANVVILLLVLLQILPRVVKYSKLDSRYQDVLGKITLGIACFVSVFFLVHIIIWDYNIINKAKNKEVVDSKTGVTATYVTIYLVSSLFAGVVVAFSAIKAKCGSIPMGSIFPASAFLTGFLVDLAIIDMITIFGWRVVEREWTKSASITLSIIGLGFQACVFGFLCVLPGGAEFDAEEWSNRTTQEQKSTRTDSTARTSNGDGSNAA